MSTLDIGNKKLFDPTGDNIIVVSYPPGGFGNFLYLVLTVFARETVSIDGNKDFKFSEDGNSHAVVKYSQPFKPGVEYVPTILNGVNFESKKIVVKADLGLSNPGLLEVKQTFPNATIVRVAIDEDSKYPALHAFELKVKNRPVPANAYEYFDTQGNLNTIARWEAITGEKTVNIPLTQLALNPVGAIKTLLADLGLTMISEDKLEGLCGSWQNANREIISTFKNYYTSK